jgi:AraC-like DNA-binding protein
MSDDLFAVPQIDPQDETPVIKQMREQLEALTKQAKQAAKEAESLRAEKAERQAQEQQANLRSAFAQVGLNERQADLFAAVRPDVEATPETIAEFATEYGLTPKTPTEAPAASGERQWEVEGHDHPHPANFFPPPTGAAPQIPGEGKITRQEFEAMNPAQRWDLISRGQVERVKWNNERVNEEIAARPFA